jgi:hypothetical protein
MTTKIEKPTVHFFGEPHYWMWDTKNEIASLFAVINHPHLGMCYNVRTSTVKQKFPDGSFETRNTMYVPATKEMTDEFERQAKERTESIRKWLEENNKSTYSQTGLAGS